MNRSRIVVRTAAALAAACIATVLPAHRAVAAWEPSKPVELIVPAGTGGGADQMARLIQGIVSKHALMAQPLVVINKSGGAGGEAFLDVKSSAGNPHKIVITLSNLFTTPLATGIPFNWRDLTPVGMLALDEFVLWVNAESTYQSAADYIAAVKAGDDKAFKMAGTGSKQEDQIITVAVEKVTGKKLTYVPYKGGGEVATQLVGKHVDSTVNNPIEAVAHWRGGKLRPLCVFDGQRMPYTAKMTETQAWADIPTCREAGVDVEYLMLRGIFTVPGAAPDVVAFYQGLLEKVRATPEWAEFMEKGAFNQSAMTGADFSAWLEKAEVNHQQLMRDAGFLAK
ncbi:MAG: tripartite tricarboxylate transporter substrate binding protein [Ectothiorhodospiraceae bacterium]|nr:tripartite tricarboxylate transporter substrate binding protein [Ectothiorhodospiraceae bacterium]